MYKKTVKDRYLVLLILFTFCLSSATLGEFLLFGSELHKACPVINHFLHTHFYPEYHYNFSEILSVHHSGINRFCSTGLYQLTSSYLM